MRDVPIVECFLSIISVWWAIVLFFDEGFFRVPKVYDPLAAIEDGWGYVFLTAAFLKIIGIILDKNWVRRVGLSFSVFLYALIAAGYILAGDAIHTGTGVYFALAVLALYQIREVKAHAD